MATFPQSEAEILALGQEVHTGLTAQSAIFPDPPVSLADLGAAILQYVTARDAANAAQATAEQATADKDAALEVLAEAIKSELRYAENHVDFDDQKLQLIGWGGRSPATPLAPPQQARTLEAPRQGEGWVFLDWKAPVGGGRVAAYRVQRRQRPEGPWLDVATAIDSEITLVDQTRGTEWEYRVIAVNKAGEAEPSNTVLAVL